MKNLEVEELNPERGAVSGNKILTGLADPVALRPSLISQVWRFLRRNPLTLLGLVVILFWITIAIIAPIIAPYNPVAQVFRDRNQAPGPNHLFGTDELGRDIFSRVLYGA